MHRTLSGGAPDSVLCPRELDAQLFTFGNVQMSSAIIHRTVRCTTGQCPVPQERATLNSPASRNRSAKIHRTVRFVTGQCPVHTGLSGVPAEQRLLPRQRSPAEAFNARQSVQNTGTREKAHQTFYRTCPVHHRTAQTGPQVRAPTVEPQRSADVAGAPDRVRWLTGLSGAPCDSTLPTATLWWLGL